MSGPARRRSRNDLHGRGASASRPFFVPVASSNREPTLGTQVYSRSIDAGTWRVGLIVASCCAFVTPQNLHPPQNLQGCKICTLTRVTTCVNRRHNLCRQRLYLCMHVGCSQVTCGVATEVVSKLVQSQRLYTVCTAPVFNLSRLFRDVAVCLPIRLCNLYNGVAGPCVLLPQKGF